MARKRVRFPVELLRITGKELDNKMPCTRIGGNVQGKYPADLISMGEIYISAWIYSSKINF